APKKKAATKKKTAPKKKAATKKKTAAKKGRAMVAMGYERQYQAGYIVARASAHTASPRALAAASLEGSEATKFVVGSGI
ncbi:hypothetical protein THAOC_26322, partial [Thalassiosira oceanica]